VGTSLFANSFIFESEDNTSFLRFGESWVLVENRAPYGLVMLLPYLFCYWNSPAFSSLLNIFFIDCRKRHRHWQLLLLFSMIFSNALSGSGEVIEASVAS
jgi:hypothetical protein